MRICSKIVPQKGSLHKEVITKRQAYISENEHLVAFPMDIQLSLIFKFKFVKMWPH